MQRIVKWSFVSVLALALVIFSIVNRSPVTFSLFPLPYEIQVPLFILLYITLFIGVVLGEGLGLLHHYKFRKQLKESQQRIKALESELLIKTMEKGSNPSNIKVLTG